MKVETLQILWHGGEPVLSVHRHPTDGQRMATAGADKVVRVRANFNFHSAFSAAEKKPAIRILYSLCLINSHQSRSMHN
jgi:hypothetical protein